MVDGYERWRECLRTGEPATTDDPQFGFWRRRLGRGGPHQPVALFPDALSGECMCVAGARYAPAHRVWRPWLEAISEEAYRAAVAAGRFPDDLPTADPSAPFTTDLRTAKPVLPPMGD